MRNITVSVPDDLYRRARVKAAEQDTTVSAVVREFLWKYVRDEAEFKRLEQLQNDTIARIQREHANPPYFSAEDRLSRDEVHDRDALRRLERSPVQR